MAKDTFRTEHNLKFLDAEQSPFPGFRAFAIGGFAGYYRLPEGNDPRMSVDIMVGVVTIAEHITDVVQWFTSLASELGCLGVRALNVENQTLRGIFTQRYGFHPADDGSLVKFNFFG